MAVLMPPTRTIVIVVYRRCTYFETIWSYTNNRAEHCVLILGKGLLSIACWGRMLDIWCVRSLYGPSIGSMLKRIKCEWTQIDQEAYESLLQSEHPNASVYFPATATCKLIPSPAVMTTGNLWGNHDHVWGGVEVSWWKWALVVLPT